MVHKADETTRGPAGGLRIIQTREHSCLAWGKLDRAKALKGRIVIKIPRNVQEDEFGAVI